MTLLRKMIIGVLTLIILVFMGTYLITLNNDRNYFMSQMHSNAQDTATSLGLSLSQAMKSTDKVSMLSMVQAVFDRGYFSMIEVTDLKGKVVVSRHRASPVTAAPSWFVNRLSWPQESSSSLVMAGWNQVGEVHVMTDPNYAYGALWKNAKGLFIWYVFFALVAIALVVGFIKWLLLPLQRVTVQALAICNREFPIESHIPKTIELKQVTLAMNKMVKRLKKLFSEQLKQAENLRKDAFCDSLTGFANRRFFLQRLSALLQNHEEFAPGYLLVVSVDGLDELNHKKGYQDGDKLIMSIATVLKALQKKWPEMILARIAGSQFGGIVKANYLQNADKEITALQKKLADAVQPFEDVKVHVALSPYQQGETVSASLVNMDKVLHQVMDSSQAASNISIKAEQHVSLKQLKDAIKHHKFELYSQAVVHGKDIYHNEVLLRMVSDTGELITAGHFLPLAEQNDLSANLDDVVLSIIIDRQLLLTHPLAINLSEALIRNRQSLDAYLTRLKSLNETCRQHLYIEINEHCVSTYLSDVTYAIQAIKALNISIGIDNVGVNFAPLHYLNELSIDYLKLHGSFTQHIDDNQSKQFFMHYFKEMAETLEIIVIATQVEDTQQVKRLGDLNIYWGQGRYLGEITKL